MEREERELVPVPVKRRERKEEVEVKDYPPEPAKLEPREMPKRWYVF